MGCLASEEVAMSLFDGAGGRRGGQTEWGLQALRGAVVQIKHEMYLRGLSLCLSVGQSVSRVRERAGLHLFPSKVSPEIPTSC